jgi:hypothetical protein
MKRRRNAKPQPVSTTPILREIQRTLKKIEQKSKKAPQKVQKDLDLEMKVLERCEEMIHDIIGI